MFCFGTCAHIASDPSNCGGCGNTCTGPASGEGRALCVAGSCDFVCGVGFVRCGSACAHIPAPRPISPPSLSRVTTTTPSFHWQLTTTGSVGARIQICDDRACTRVTTTSDVAAPMTSFTPSPALTEGVHYWRLFDLTGTGTASTVSSPVWEFFVPHRDTARDTHGALTPDFDGDGHSDLAVFGMSTSMVGAVYLYPGSSGGFATSPALTLTSPQSDLLQFGGYLAHGDVNGDGYADLAVATYGLGGSVGHVYVYYGGPAGLASTPAHDLTLASHPNFAYGLAAAGDTNGDGYEDLQIGLGGAIGWYAGSSSGLPDRPTVILTSPVPHLFPGSAGDIDGDGIDDIVGGAGGDGSAVAYRGSATGPAMAQVVHGPASTSDGAFGTLVVVEDWNGDGLADLAASDSTAGVGGRAFYYQAAGGSPPFPVIPTATFERVVTTGTTAFGYWMAAVGDVNHDGYQDLGIGDAAANAGVGESYLFMGSSSGLAATPMLVLRPVALGVNAFALVDGVGDVTGDRIDDFVVAAPGHVSFYLGMMSPLGFAPVQEFGPPPGTPLFGYSVAHLR
jgi:hypothetical protein